MFTAKLYHLCFPVPLPSDTNNTFYQTGTGYAKTNYWLSVTVQGTNYFGWKSSATAYNDFAVGSASGNFYPTNGNWFQITDTNYLPLNMAFMIGTATNACTTPPQLQCSDLIVNCTNLTRSPPVPVIVDPCCPAGSSTLSMSAPFVISNCPTVYQCNWHYTNCQGLTAFCSSYVTVTSAPPVLVPTNVTIMCGSPIPTNPPGVKDLCCSNIVPVWQYSLTNSSACKLVITQYWKAVDCNCTNLYTIGTQTITVLDTNAPILIGCGTNMTVLWGNPWSFAVPAAQYACSGSNAPVSILSSNVVTLSSCGSINTIVWSATNLCSSAYSTCTQIVTVVCTPCVESNGVKYVQRPNLSYGFDVWNNGLWMLADDFICTNSGPISDIHIWGSWLNDQVGRNTLTFWLGIYDDVPASPTNAYSHPGNLLWSQWFSSGQYAENLSATGQENFLKPEPPSIMGPDSQVWYYCFYPKCPLFQSGSVTRPKTYWLAAYAQPPTNNQFQYGWKTTQFVQNDVSVHAAWPGNPMTNVPAWNMTRDPQSVPLDLAFKITTDTNYNNNMKYIQWPNTNYGAGYDVWNSSTRPLNAQPGSGPWVLADDFVCTNTGYISDLHLWGSWQYDSMISNNITFWIGLFNDVPITTNTAGQVIPSHPVISGHNASRRGLTRNPSGVTPPRISWIPARPQ